METVDLDALAVAVYDRAFAADASLAAMFTSDPVTQRTRFAAELATMLGSIRSFDVFCSTTRSLGARHRSYGVQATHYRLMGDALMAALAAALGPRWTGEVDEAWALAYNFMAETMMIGALDRGT